MKTERDKVVEVANIMGWIRRKGSWYEAFSPNFHVRRHANPGDPYECGHWVGGQRRRDLPSIYTFAWNPYGIDGTQHLEALEWWMGTQGRYLQLHHSVRPTKDSWWACWRGPNTETSPNVEGHTRADAMMNAAIFSYPLLPLGQAESDGSD